MEVVYRNNNGKIIHGDNLEVMKELEENSVDTCISDFPYWLEFMGKSWDKGIPYDFTYPRAVELHRIIKSGGYVLIFGHPKTNHRMKCAFEDAGFNIVEEIDWIYFSGFPKNQDIGKMFDKRDGAEREIVGTYKTPNGRDYTLEQSGKEGYNNTELSMGRNKGEERRMLTSPSTDLAKQWDGWKTAGLKPAKEPITVFQKPFEGTYCDNIAKWNVGGFNIDACRITISQEDVDMLNAKASKNPTTNYGDKDDKIYGKYAKDMAMPPNTKGRFPSNIIFDEFTGRMLDEQSGIRTSGKMKAGQERKNTKYCGCETGLSSTIENETYGDSGGGSRFFYCAKSAPKEKILSDGTKNPHVTVKPVSLIKWLIKLVTPKDGVTIDITSGSGTHAIAVEELNRDEGYNMKWLNIEITNTEQEPYCDFAKKRLDNIVVLKEC